MEYPFIGQQYSAIILFYAKDKGIVLDDALGLDEDIKVGEKININDSANITHKYLSNTWGVVESKEHVEFIIGLAKLHGFKVIIEHGAGIDELKFFSVTDCGCLYLWIDDDGVPPCREQITIPLPPKDKEWPQVGDEVMWSNGHRRGKLKCAYDGWAWVKVDDNDFTSIMVEKLKKPKTEQELKIEELQTKLCNLNAVDNYILASEIVMGNVEGLSYE